MWYDNHEHIKLIKELYKCHFTAKEVAVLTNKSYQSVLNIYRGLRYSEIEKYDRITLSDWEGFNRARAING